MNIFLLVEGSLDKDFFVSLIKERFEFELKKEQIEILGGKDWYRSEIHSPRVINSIRRENEKGNRVLILHDADNDLGNQRQRLESFKHENNLNFELFFLPNDESNGELEDLLISISNVKYSSLFDCFEEYTQCIKSKNFEQPDSKSKIYAFIEAVYGSKKFKKAHRNFQDKELWNLESEILNPIINFIDKNSKKE